MGFFYKIAKKSLSLSHRISSQCLLLR